MAKRKKEGFPIHDVAAVRSRLLDVERARQLRDRDPLLERAIGVTPQPESLVRTMIGDILESLGRYLRTGAPRALLFGVVGFGVGWLFNVYIMVWLYDGFRVSTGGAATGRGNILWGGMTWTVLSVIVATVVSYRLSAGKERFWQDVREFPVTIRAMFRSDGDRAVVHLLWGFAGSMLAVLVLAPTFSAILAVGVLVALGTALRPLVTGIVLTVWRAAGRVFFPDRPVQPQVVSVVVVACGTALAFAVGYVIQGWLLRIVVAVLAGGLAWVLAQRLGGPRAAGGAAAALMGAIALLWVLEPSVAYADDGGWRECGSSLQRWIGCQGSLEVLLRSLLGGAASALGSVFGSALGDGLAPADTSNKKYADMTDSEKRKHLADHLLDKYPGISPEDAAEAARQIVDGEDVGVWSSYFEEKSKQASEGWEKLKAEVDFLRSKDFRDAFMDEYWSDLASGDQLDRIIKTMEGLLGTPERVLGELFGAAGALWENREQLTAAAMEWIATADADAIASALQDIDLKMAELMLGHYRDQLTALHAASLAGDNDRIAQIVSELGGDAQFDILMGAGFAKVLEGGGSVIRGLRHSDGPDAPKKPRGDGPDDTDRLIERKYAEMEAEGRGPGGKADGPDGGPRKDWAAEDPYARPRMSVDEIERKFRNLEPGDRLKLTPEEAAAWGGFEQQMLIEQRGNSLQWGTKADAGERPWVELKRGNEDALRLRQEGYYDGQKRYDYDPKPNHIGDKSIVPEEMRFMPRDADLVPGEVGAYRPTRIPDEGEVSQELRDRLIKRQKEWADYEAGRNVQTSGPVIDRYGKQVLGEAELGPDGRWYSRQQVPDGQGRHPTDRGYQETWSDYHRVAGDNDTFAIGAGDDFYAGRRVGGDADAPHLGYDRMDSVDGWKMTEAERLQYAASGGTVPGEGNPRLRYTPDDPNYSQHKYDSTIQKATNEGVLLIDADGYYLTRPGAHYGN